MLLGWFLCLDYPQVLIIELYVLIGDTSIKFGKFVYQILLCYMHMRERFHKAISLSSSHMGCIKFGVQVYNLLSILRLWFRHQITYIHVFRIDLDKLKFIQILLGNQKMKNKHLGTGEAHTAVWLGRVRVWKFKFSKESQGYEHGQGTRCVDKPCYSRVTTQKPLRVCL